MKKRIVENELPITFDDIIKLNTTDPILGVDYAADDLGDDMEVRTLAKEIARENPDITSNSIYMSLETLKAQSRMLFKKMEQTGNFEMFEEISKLKKIISAYEYLLERWKVWKASSTLRENRIKKAVNEAIKDFLRKQK